MDTIIQIDPQVMGGTPVFKGTRVPIQTLFDYIEGGESIEAFIDDFPTVIKVHVIQLLEQLKDQAIRSNLAA